MEGPKLFLHKFSYALAVIPEVILNLHSMLMKLKLNRISSAQVSDTTMLKRVLMSVTKYLLNAFGQPTFIMRRSYYYLQLDKSFLTNLSCFLLCAQKD